MQIGELSIKVVFVNLSFRQDRRIELLELLDSLNIEAERSLGIHASWVSDPRGFQNSQRYACSLAKRIAIRKGMSSGADAVLLLEDDLAFHPEFTTRLENIVLPPKWGLFYLGCRHCRCPKMYSKNIVVCERATDNHAVIIHRDYYGPIMRGLSGSKRGALPTFAYSDLKLAEMQNIIPSFAVFPNLVWQKVSHSNTSGFALSNYFEDGRQILNSDIMAEFELQMESAF